MLQVTLDKHTLIELLGCLEELEICDESGQVMARLTPDPVFRRKTYDRINALFPEERIRAALSQPRGKGRSLTEILKDLESKNGSLQSRLESPGGVAAGEPVAERGGP